MFTFVELYVNIISTYATPFLLMLLLLSESDKIFYKIKKKKLGSEGVRYFLFGSNGDIMTEYSKIGTDAHGEIIAINTAGKIKNFIYNKKFTHRIPKNHKPYGNELAIFYHHTSLHPIDLGEVNRSESPDVLASVMETKFMKELTTPEKSILEDKRTMAVIVIIGMIIVGIGIAKWQGWI